MGSNILDRVRSSLIEKSANLKSWLSSANELQVNTHTGLGGRDAVEAQLSHLDEVIEKVDQGKLGECVICHQEVDDQLLELDYTACVCLAHFAEHEVRQLERELELAVLVQRALLPETLPELTGFELAVFTRPAQIVSGDYYDFLRFKDGRTGLVIADIAGHGVSSGLLMASVQTALRTLAPASASPLDVMRQIDHLYSRNINLTSFFSLFLGKFTEDGQLEFCNAGHNPPILFHPKDISGKQPVEYLDPTGAAIGLVEGLPFQSKTIGMRPGDILVLYTDGLSEAVNAYGEQFGVEGIIKCLQRATAHSAHGLIHQLHHDLVGFSAGQSQADDITIVVCKVKE